MAVRELKRPSLPSLLTRPIFFRGEPRARVLVYGEKPRLITLPRSALAKFPAEAEYSFDNARITREWSMLSALLFALLGSLYSVATVFGQQQALGLNAVVTLTLPTLLGLLAGWFIGKKKIAPLFHTRPHWFVRRREVSIKDESDEPHREVIPEAVVVDHQIWYKWVQYFQEVKALLEARDTARKQADQRESETMINPVAVEAVTTRFHPGTMAAIERMDNVAEDISGGISWGQKAIMAGVAGAVFAAFAGLIVFTVVIGDQKAAAEPQAFWEVLYAVAQAA